MPIRLARVLAPSLPQLTRLAIGRFLPPHARILGNPPAGPAHSSSEAALPRGRRTDYVVVNASRCSVPAGVTLVELLCTMAIIAVLATMLLGPAGRAMSKARGMQWNNRAVATTAQITDRLRAMFAGQKAFRRITLEDLERDRVLPASDIGFLRDARVTFMPFAGDDPDGQPVIAVRLKPAFLGGGGDIVVTKGDLTREAP